MPNWVYFSRKEMECKGTGECDMDEGFMSRLIKVREKYNKPMIITYRLIRIAIEAGMTGIGISQRGPHEKRFIHLDDMDNSGEHPRPWVWSYK